MVRAENIYTVEHFKAAQTTLPRGKTPYIAITALILFAVLFGSFAIVRTLKAFRDDRAADAYIMAISAVLVVEMGYKIVKALVSRDKIYEKAAAKRHFRHFEIDGNELVMTIDSEIEHSERHFVMNGIHRAHDTGRFFIIYMYEDMYCMIGYDDITEGSPEELRSLLYNALGDRLSVK